MKEIVYVDDSIMEEMQYFPEYLKLDGFTVQCFDDDAAALQYVEEHHKDVGLIILDVIMPSRLFTSKVSTNFFDTGLLLLKKLRQVVPRVPVILFSIRNDLHENRELDALDVSQIIVKDTTTPKELSETVRNIIGAP